MNGIRRFIKNRDIFRDGWKTLMNISEGNCSVQEAICANGGLWTLLDALRMPNRFYRETDWDLYCRTIEVVLSSTEVHSKFCTASVLDAVEKWSKEHKGDERVERFLSSLKRVEDPRVRDAVSNHECTQEAFPEHCGCKWVKGVNCPKCCVRQKVFRCIRCDKKEVKFYCETCWERQHKGHEREEFFFPVKCATGQKQLRGINVF